MAIRIARENAGMTRSQLAEKAGMKAAGIGYCENGYLRLGITQLRTLAGALGVPENTFIQEIEDLAGYPEDGDDRPAIAFGPDLDGNIRKAMKAAGLARRELCRLADMPESTLADWIGGRTKKPCFFRLYRLAEALGVTVRDLKPEGDLSPNCDVMRTCAAEEILGRERGGGAPADAGPGIRKARMAAGLSQAELAKRVEGITANMICKYENGRTYPSPERMRKITEAIDAFTAEPESATDQAGAAMPGAAPDAVPGRKREHAHADIRWISIAGGEGPETSYFGGKLADLLRGMAPDGIEAVTRFAEFTLMQGGSAQAAAHGGSIT